MPSMTVAQVLESAADSFRRGQLEEAEALARRAGEHPAALHLLGLIAYKRRQLDAAIDLLRRSIAALPADPDFHSNLGLVLADARRFEEAIASHRRALALRPPGPRPGSTWATATCICTASPKPSIGRRPLGIRESRGGNRLHPPGGRTRPGQPRRPQRLVMLLHFDPAATTAAIAEEHRRWVARHAPHPPAGKLPGQSPLASRDRQGAESGARNDAKPVAHARGSPNAMRIGYVSPDLRAHVVGRSLLPVLACHDHARFEVFCYSDTLAPDEVTRQIQALCDSWRDTGGWDTKKLADQVRADGIDVLVDLAQHMGRNRLPLFAHRAAPVQVAYLGYAASTGLPAMDYRITDPYLDPPGQPSDGPERLLRLPNCYWAYRAGRSAHRWPAAVTPQRPRHVRLVQQLPQGQRRRHRRLGGDPSAGARVATAHRPARR